MLIWRNLSDSGVFPARAALPEPEDVFSRSEDQVEVEMRVIKRASSYRVRLASGLS